MNFNADDHQYRFYYRHNEHKTESLVPSHCSVLYDGGMSNSIVDDGFQS